MFVSDCNPLKLIVAAVGMLVKAGNIALMVYAVVPMDSSSVLDVACGLRRSDRTVERAGRCVRMVRCVLQVGV
tara:strand:+ start:14616 stop:14834 length:219 start_codon:yes stop_codon:yes gene_type:complete